MLSESELTDLYMKSKPKVLLPTPGKTLVTSNHQQGLLPHPRKQPLIGKRPLLHPSQVHRKPPLLDTPPLKPIAPNWKRPKLQIKDSNETTSKVNFKNNPDVVNVKVNDSKMLEPMETEAYKLHKEKLRNIAAGKSTTSVLDNVNDQPISSEQSKDSGNLSCLASFLLQMKTKSLQPPSKESVSNENTLESARTSDAKIKKLNNSEKNTSVVNSSVIVVDDMIDLHPVSETTNDHVGDQLTDQGVDSEVKRNNLSVTLNKADITKSKKHRIQLSHYASGSDLTDIDGHSKKQSSNISDKIKTEAHSVTLNIGQNKSNDTVISSVTDNSNTTPVIKEHGNEVIGDPNHLSSKKDCDSEVPKILKDKAASRTASAQEEKTSPATSKATDLPFIIPVSGYFCDVCCDFFFDEASTFDHCSTTSHINKVEIVANKPKENPKDSCKSDSSQTSHESNVFDRKQINRSSATGFAMTSSNNVPYTKQQSMNPHEGVGVSTHVRGRPSNRRGNRGRKNKWNFTIPKRK